MMAKSLPGPEAGVQSGVLQLFRLRGWHAWRVNSGALRDSTGRPLYFVRGSDNQPFRGFADVIAVVPRSGRFLACECKTPGGKLTPYQWAFLEVVRAEGGVGVVIDDIAVLDRVISALEADPWAALDQAGNFAKGE
jgi:hypothetical protein